MKPTRHALVGFILFGNARGNRTPRTSLLDQPQRADARNLAEQPREEGDSRFESPCRVMFYGVYPLVVPRARRLPLSNRPTPGYRTPFAGPSALVGENLGVAEGVLGATPLPLRHLHNNWAR